jgi:hypothetical protein
MSISVFAIAEQWPNSALQGHALGVNHAIATLHDMNAKGVPADRPAYFAVDFDVQENQWPAVRDYFNGIHTTIPLARIGIYGGHNAMVWAYRDGIADWFFQTYAWSGGVWFSGNHIEQYGNNHLVGGAQVDFCRSVQADFGQWGGAPIPAGISQPGTTPVTGPQSWDYAGQISAHAANEAGFATTLDSYTADLDQLRTY